MANTTVDEYKALILEYSEFLKHAQATVKRIQGCANSARISSRFGSQTAKTNRLSVLKGELSQAESQVEFYEAQIQRFNDQIKALDNTPLVLHRRIYKSCECGRNTCDILEKQVACCFCMDDRPKATTYWKYVDGIGDVYTAKRHEFYCPQCVDEKIVVS